jgi:hypothetical protein
MDEAESGSSRVEEAGSRKEGGGLKKLKRVKEESSEGDGPL